MYNSLSVNSESDFTMTKLKEQNVLKENVSGNVKTAKVSTERSKRPALGNLSLNTLQIRSNYDFDYKKKTPIQDLDSSNEANVDDLSEADLTLVTEDQVSTPTTCQSEEIPDFVANVPKYEENYGENYFFPSYIPPPMTPRFLPPTPAPFSPSFPLNYPVPQFIQTPVLSETSVVSEANAGITATVEQDGYIRLKLRSNVVLDININMAIRLMNLSKESSLTISSSAKHSAIIHPKGRVLIYEPRVEVQTEDSLSVKNAKVYPRGISFTANNMALVYLLDEAGARSTSDMFHDLYATNITDTLFEESLTKDNDIRKSVDQLDRAQYWRTETNVDCWIFDDILVKQTSDGLVIVERVLETGARIVMKASPSNGKIRLDSEFVQVIINHYNVIN